MTKERRKHPRIKDKNISVKLKGENFSAITQSLDVSASGIYCKVTERIPLMTRLQIVLSLPGKKPLNVEGIVVREHPVMKEGRAECYDVAIFFNALMPEERKTLTQYIENKN